MTRSKYQEFPLDVFRGHIKQQVKARKQQNYNKVLYAEKWWKLMRNA
jgi:hypothetical protein